MSEEQPNIEQEELPQPEEVAENTSPAEEATAQQEPSNGYEKRIAALTAQKYKKDQELAQLKAELATKEALNNKSADVVIPELPDDDLRYENKDEYAKKLKAYHDAVALKALNDAEAKRQESQKQEAERAKQEQLSERHTEIVSGYIENGLKQGISEERMAANEHSFREAGLNSDIAEHIYSDPNGAKIVDYLASNPDKLQELAAAPAGRAYIEIENNIKKLALSTKPTHTQAPDPIQPTRGGGPTPTAGLPPVLTGATFS